MLNELLVDLGYSVTATTDSLEALEIFKESPEDFDLVITDQTMPNMTGAELVESIHGVRPEVPAILCTGFSSVINEEKAKNKGFKAFVKKPFYRHEIADTIRKVLDVDSGSSNGTPAV